MKSLNLNRLGSDTGGLILALIAITALFSLWSPRFLSLANFGSMGFQMPLLGLLTLAMLAPIISGGMNLAIIYTANISGLTLAWILIQFGGPDASIWAMILGCLAAMAVGMLSGAIIGAVVAYVGAHPIIVSLAMMILLRGLGEFLTRGGDISGFPDYVGVIGHGDILGIPVPLIFFGIVAAVWYVLLKRTQHGFSVYMTGSNISCGGICRIAHQADARFDLHPVGPVMCSGRDLDGGPLQLGTRRARRGNAAGNGAGLFPRRHRPVRRPRTRRAGRAFAFDPAGAVLGPQPDWRQPAPGYGHLGSVPDPCDGAAVRSGEVCAGLFQARLVFCRTRHRTGLGLVES